MIITIINIVLFINYNIYSDIPVESIENTTDYPELKEYRQELKAYIEQLKKERTDKETYLISLDKEYIELEIQYNKLLEEKKRISEKLDCIKGVQQ